MIQPQAVSEPTTREDIFYLSRVVGFLEGISSELDESRKLIAKEYAENLGTIARRLRTTLMPSIQNNNVNQNVNSTSENVTLPEEQQLQYLIRMVKLEIATHTQQHPEKITLSPGMIDILGEYLSQQTKALTNARRVERMDTLSEIRNLFLLQNAEAYISDNSYKAKFQRVLAEVNKLFLESLTQEAQSSEEGK